RMSPARAADAGSNELAEQIRAVLDRTARSSGRISGGDPMAQAAQGTGGATSTATLTKPSVTNQRRYNAPPEKVYDAWTHAEMIVGWFGPSDAEQGSVKAMMDVRTGGRFTISFTHSNGEYSEVSGVYKEVVPNQKLVFSWAWHSTPERESQ